MKLHELRPGTGAHRQAKRLGRGLSTLLGDAPVAVSAPADVRPDPATATPMTAAGESLLEIEEYSHHGMVGRYVAGAHRLPFYPLRSYSESDLPTANPLIRQVESPYGDGSIWAVPPLNPDVAIIHAQRADAEGNVQMWGLLGCQKEAAFAAKRVIAVVEEIVPTETIRADPNRTIVPGLIVSAVVHEPFGAHPSYVQGAYDRDNAFYREWDAISREAAATDEWLREWVYGVPDRTAYIAKMDAARLRALRPTPAPSGSVDYGDYR